MPAANIVFEFGGANEFRQAQSKSLIELKQSTLGKDKLFTVTYGMQVEKQLTYAQAAHKLGECLMHFLTCEGAVNNQGA